MSIILARYLKGIVAVLGAVSIALETAYPDAQWSHTVTAGIAALLVILVPNARTPSSRA